MTTLFSFPDVAVLLNLLLQVSLLCVFALLALRLFGSSATRRYAIAYSCLLATALLAVSSLYLQAKEINLLALRIDLPALQASPLESLVPESADAASYQFSTSPPPAAMLDLPLAQYLFDRVQGNGQIAMPVFVSGLAAILVLVWVLGMGVSWLRIALAARSLNKLAARSNAMAGPESDKLCAVLEGFPYQTKLAQLRSSTEISSPVQVGFLHPKILLPAGFISHSSENQIRAVLLHESAHWQRRDNLANLLQKIIVALFWWHPLLWQLDGVIARAREEICDNYVLAEIDPVEYGEALLKVNALRETSGSGWPDGGPLLAAGIVDASWSLEHRISDLIDRERERSMKLSIASFGGIVMSVLATTLTLAAFAIAPLSEPLVAQSVQEPADQEPRPAPEARTTMTLSPQVLAAIEEIQELLNPESDNIEPDPQAGKAALDALYEEVFATANDFEKSTILNFYTNYYLMEKDYPGAIARFEALLQIENLRPDIRLRTLRSLGQLYGQQQRWQESIDAYQDWIAIGRELDGVVARGLSYAYFNLESWQQARTYWQTYLNDFVADEPSRDDLAYLNGLHYQLEDYDAALSLTREMILQFNNQTDWDNLRALQQELEQIDAIAELDPDLGGTISPGSAEPEIAFATVVPTDADYLPLVAVAPMYPPRAAEEGVEGWILLEFTVTPQGQVDEQTIDVVDSDPQFVFNRAAIRAATDFIFAPRMEDGEAVAVPGVQYLFRFRLEDEDA